MHLKISLPENCPYSIKNIDSLHYTQFGKVRNSRDTGGKNGFQNHMRSLEMSGTPEVGKTRAVNIFLIATEEGHLILLSKDQGAKSQLTDDTDFLLLSQITFFQTEKNVVCQPRTECSDSES